MFIESLKITGVAVAQIFVLGLIGYFLIKKKIISSEGLDAISRLLLDIIFPILIFCQLVKDFDFRIYANWWIFPLLSIVITAAGLLAGMVFNGFIRGEQHKMQFLSLSGFQNSGYLPLALFGALLGPDKLGPMFIHLFMFLMGFNLVMFSLGVHMLTFDKEKRFDYRSFFSPPVIATLFTLGFVFFGLNKFVPQEVLKPLRMIGDCTLPLAMFVVGGNLAQINLVRIDRKPIFLLLLAKLILLPALGLWFVLAFRLPELIGLLVVVQLAMPSATTLSVLVRNYKKEDLLVSQGIFFTHILSIITIPVFLSLYFALGMIE